MCLHIIHTHTHTHTPPGTHAGTLTGRGGAGGLVVGLLDDGAATARATNAWATPSSVYRMGAPSSTNRRPPVAYVLSRLETDEWSGVGLTVVVDVSAPQPPKHSRASSDYPFRDPMLSLLSFVDSQTSSRSKLLRSIGFRFGLSG